MKRREEKVEAVQVEAVQVEAVQVEAVQVDYSILLTDKQAFEKAYINAQDKKAFIDGAKVYRDKVKAEAEKAEAEKAEAEAAVNEFFPVATTTIPTIADYTLDMLSRAGIVNASGKVVKMRLAAFLYYDGIATTPAAIACKANELVKGFALDFTKPGDAKGSDFGNLIRDCKGGNCHQYYRDYRAANPIA